MGTGSQAEFVSQQSTPETVPISIQSVMLLFVKEKDTWDYYMYGNRDMEMSLKLRKMVFFLQEAGPTQCMKQDGTNPGGHGAIYSGDDTWADSIKRRLKEACGDNVKRQVVDFT